MLSLEKLYDEWAEHPLGRNRAVGGRRSLSGFRYQLYVTLDRFFARVVAGERDAQFVFDGLSDLAETEGELVYLTQVKSQLGRRELGEAVEEAVAVDRFLAERHPELRERLRYQLAIRRPASRPIDIASLAAEDIPLSDLDTDQWIALRQRFQPVRVHGAPEVDLALRLWPEVRHCFGLIDSCLGRLLDLLGEYRPSEAIATELLRLWDQARAEPPLPVPLLGPQDFVPAEPKNRIVHGVRPTFEDLTDGCFMERSAWLEQILLAARTVWSAAERAEGRRPLPVFWVGGPSGTGKSVLLLQAVRELVLRGDADAAQFLAEFAHRLPEALEVSSRTSRRLVLAVDDLFALSNRDPGLWRQIAEVASLRTWSSLPLILTCGPPEQLKAFERECRRHSGLQLASISLTPLEEGEQLQYNAWYRERTDHDAALRSEPIFVAATWAYELSCRARLSPEAFSQRFDDRLQELGLQAAARAALALNGYGLAASPALFAGCEDALEQLKSEQIYRLGQQGTGSRSGFFFHPRIAKILYDVLVSQTTLRERAQDLARGFRGMLTIPEVGSSFLEWLAGARAESLLQPTLQKEVLAALWSVFTEAGPLESVIPVTFRWHRLARDKGLDLAALGAQERIRTWLTNTAEDAPPWALLFQMVWSDGSVEERDQVFAIGFSWLNTQPDHRSWTYVWHLLWAHERERSDLALLGLLWLLDHAGTPGWSYVWQGLYDSGFREPELIDTGLQGIANGPETSADFHLWQKVAAIADRTALCDALVRNLARRLFRKTGIKLLFDLANGASVVTLAATAFYQTQEEACWTLLWQELQAATPDDLALLALGEAWLQRREDRPEWSHIWRVLLAQDYHRAELLQRGLKWLDQREDRPEWNYNWRALLEQDYQKNELLQRGLKWLDQREDRAEWNYNWKVLLAQGYQRDQLLQRGLKWLDQREDRPAWSYIWQSLLAQDYQIDELLQRGLKWLDQREDRPEWAFIWEMLLDRGYKKDELIKHGFKWLDNRLKRPEWSYVWEKLFEYDRAQQGQLHHLATQWLQANPNHPRLRTIRQRIAAFD